MADFVFTSPGVKFRERDISFVSRSLSITTLGVVGETLKGPAFEPIYVQDKTEFEQRFGKQSIKKLSEGTLQYQLPYVANAYLSESNQLWVTRVLGLSGYNAGKAWAVTLNAGVDLSTTGATTSTLNTGVAFADFSYLGVALVDVNDTGTSFSGFTKVGSTDFEGYMHSFTATTVNPDGTGTVDDLVTLITGSSYVEYENMVLAIIRSRGRVQDNANLPSSTLFNTTSLTITGNTTNIDTGDLFGQFTLVAASTASTENYVVSLNPNSSSFLSNVVGSEAKDKTTKIWVQSIFPDLIKKLDADGLGYGVNTTLIDCNSSYFTDYKTQFKTPETPWVVSQLKGNAIDRLFKFISISDGDAANQEIKISIVNVNPITLEFDVIIRDFYDTDDKVSILESFTRCSLIQGTTNYIAQRIGTSDGEYSLKSKYVMLEMSASINVEDFPAGFEGYAFNNYAISATSTTSGEAGVTPKVFYKTSYNDDEKIKKVYLGVSEKGYDGSGLIGTGINQNFFNFTGIGGFVYSKGFHLDSGVTSTYNGFDFEVGAGDFQTVDDILDVNNPYYDINTRKFTLVPNGGFDGWDVNRGVNGASRSYGDLYRANGIYDGVSPNTPPSNDFQAWETAINTFSNPEEVTINIFATPGINWSDQNILVKEAIDMIETERTDTLYVIDSPDVNIAMTIGDGGKADVIASQDIVDLMDTAEIDSNYACTYFPWIQIRDNVNNVNIYIPPTGEVLKAMAFTDNNKFPWFAPAGLSRGVTDAIKSKYKLSLDARDVLYEGRINPIADFADVGTAIFGQKTLQVRDSLLTKINVRRLLLQVKVLISNIAVRLLFEQNDQTTIDQFLQKTTPLLDSIKRERGLIDFRVSMGLDSDGNSPESRDRGELYGNIRLKPSVSLEYVGLTFTITPSGASFEDVGA
jgi:hypothetical protein